jgi:tRNA G10  N-methylase Trm11
MEFIASCVKGLEFVTEKDTNGKKVIDGKVLFEKECEVRGAFYTYELLKKFKFKDLEDIQEKSRIDFKIKGKFKVECKREGEHEFNSKDVENAIGEIIEGEVDLKNPDTVIFVDIEDDYIFLGKNIKKYKRDYKVRTNADSISGQVAYCLLKVANIKEKSKILDPLCKDGTLLLEAYEMGCKDLTGLNEDIKNVNVNCKIRKADIKLECGSLDWIDTKFKAKEFEFIITKLHAISKRKGETLIKSLIKEFLHQSDYVLKDDGEITVLMQRDELFKEILKEFKFEIVDEFEFKTGVGFKILKLKKLIVKS